MPSEKRARQRAAREARLAAEARSAKRRRQIRNGIIVVIVAGAIVGIAFLVSSNNNPVGKQSSTSTTESSAAKTNAHLQAEANAAAEKAGCPASPTTPANTQHYTAAPAMTIDTTKSYSATVKTTTGTFVVGLDAQAAPKTVNNFVFLAEKGFFHCNSFFRVIPNFVNQTGNPAQTNANSTTSGAAYTLPPENLPATGTAGNPTYPAGSLAMATSSAGVSGSQFFIVAGSQGEALPNSYPLFGLVTSGLHVVQTINQQGSSSGTPPDVTQRILSVTIHES
ncbi:MAG TPA: peptidylprolyl isomerase [Acidimicrobiales bacterium]|nr:peptidylprolyl isomerase [Acidimicrobiales bacterium]